MSEKYWVIKIPKSFIKTIIWPYVKQLLGGCLIVIGLFAVIFVSLESRLEPLRMLITFFTLLIVWSKLSQKIDECLIQ